MTEKELSVYATGSYQFPKLWQQLRAQCIDGDKGRDVMVIPHNPNLSGGLMVALDQFASRNMLRNVLKDGLAMKEKSGVNPFQMGFIGSTDTHNSTPGGTEEDSFAGHLGQRDGGYRTVQDHFAVNPFADTCQQQADALTALAQDEQGAKGDVYGNCCKKTEQGPFYSPVIQERAWSSPIWYTPERQLDISLAGPHIPCRHVNKAIAG